MNTTHHTPGRCLNCDKKIGPLFMRPTPDFPRGDTPTRSGSVHALDPDGYFCRLRCAASYGARMARSLYRESEVKR